MQLHNLEQKVNTKQLFKISEVSNLQLFLKKSSFICSLLVLDILVDCVESLVASVFRYANVLSM